MNIFHKPSLLTPNRYDVLLVAAVWLLAAALGLGLWRGETRGDVRQVVVAVDGAVRERFPLCDTKRDYCSNGYTLRVAATSEGVRVEQSDCPTRDCVRTGTISRAGESIVCLPARLTVTLEGAPTFDAAAG